MDNYGYDDVQFVYTDSCEIAVRIHNSNRHVRIYHQIQKSVLIRI